MTDPLVVDLYSGDVGGRPSWSTLAAAGEPWCGAIIKATQDTYTSGWFVDNWQPLLAAGHERYASTWWRGAYHYLNVGGNPVAQACAYLAAVDAAGGWGAGDLWPIVDVERAGNTGASKQQTIDTVSEWSDAIVRRVARRPMLYGGSFLRDLGITDHMGCQLLWFPRWSATLPESAYGAIGWTRAELWGWQYCGDGTASLPGYPATSPIGKVDITAMVIDDAAGPAAPNQWTHAHVGSWPLA